MLRYLMLKRLNVFAIIIICFFAGNAHSLESTRILVLPFEILGTKDFTYLQDEITGAIKKHLNLEGAVVLDMDIALNSFREKDAGVIDDIRRLGISQGADYIVWGNLTWIGKRFSLKAKLVESDDSELPEFFFVEGESIESLPDCVKRIAGDIGRKLFKLEKVARVLVTGNKRIESAAIFRIIKTKPGDMYLAKSLSEDLKAIYEMGYFDDIRIESEKGPEGKIIIFNVQEKPTIREIKFKGNLVIKDEKIKEDLTIKTGSILNIYGVRSNIVRIKALYKDKSYHNVEVTYNVYQGEHNQADLEFVIEEGKKVKIKEIIFQGNRAYTNKELKKITNTSEKGFFSWLSSSGELNKEKLNQDIAILSAFYRNNGYINARVGNPQIEYKGNWIYITIKIDEGARYRVGKVSMEGDLLLPAETLLKTLKIVMEEFYNQEVLRHDLLALTDFYSDFGYAYADISPMIEKNPGKMAVDIIFVIKKSKQVYFEKIIISGNTKTRDKVIRRQLSVYEQGLYSGRRMKAGAGNLRRLGYFEDVKVNTEKGSADDKIILKVDVTEGPTGSFSFGGGYSSIENVFAMFSISQSNLFGRGQTLKLDSQVGGVTTMFNLNFVEPWLFDIPLAAGIDVYKWETSYDTYTADRKGAGFNFSYPVFRNTRAFTAYTFEVVDVDEFDWNASTSILALEGSNTASKVSIGLSYDSRNRYINTQRGSRHKLTIQYAGLGGDVGFTKFTGETGWYIPLVWETVGFLHGKSGYVVKNSGGILPDYERFYLGGMNSLRGFDWQDISPKDEYGFAIGGDKFVQFNFEIRFPLVKSAGLVGVLFFDAGDVYDNGESIELGNLRKSTGFGVRWNSPMGPIRIENGFIIHPEEGERSGGHWEFAMGSAF